MNDLTEAILLADYAKQAVGRTGDKAYIAKLTTHFAEACAIARIIAAGPEAGGPGSKTDSGVPHTDTRARMLRTLEDAWRVPAPGARGE